MMLPLLYVSAPFKRVHTYILSAWGVYSVHLSVWCLAIPRFLMNSIEFLTLFNNGKPAATGKLVQAHYKHKNCGI